MRQVRSRGDSGEADALYFTLVFGVGWPKGQAPGRPRGGPRPRPLSCGRPTGRIGWNTLELALKLPPKRPTQFWRGGVTDTAEERVA